MLNTILHALELRQAASLRRIANTPGAPLGPQARARHLAEARNRVAEARAIRTLSLAAAHQQHQNRGQA